MIKSKKRSKKTAFTKILYFDFDYEYKVIRFNLFISKSYRNYYFDEIMRPYNA